MSAWVAITNRNAFRWHDRYSGVRYTFPPRERVVIPAVVAQHIFGYGEADKTRMMRRTGLNIREDGPGILNRVLIEECGAPGEEAPAEPLDSEVPQGEPEPNTEANALETVDVPEPEPPEPETDEVDATLGLPIGGPASAA